ncbi:MAG: hypothetical protein ACHQF3_13800, partial [Alphaproteobacteria bacterium]
LDVFHPVSPQEMATDKWMGKPGAKDTGAVKSLTVQAQFLKETGQINAMPADMSGLVDASFLAKMVG